MPDDITDDPGSSRRPRRDDDYEPNRYDDLDVSRRPPLSWIDRQFLNTSIVVIVIASLCCGVFAFPFGVVGLVTCQDATARKRALIMVIISGVIMALQFVGQVSRVLVDQR